MSKKVQVDRKRMERFGFTKLEGLKSAVAANPEVAEQLKRDPVAAMAAHGVVLDDKLREEIRAEWRSRIRADVRKEAERPGSKNWALKSVIKGKPIRVSVDISEDGKKRIKKGGSK